MSRANDAEMTSIQCCDRNGSQALGRDDHRRIDRPERQISILSHELGDAEPVARWNRIGSEVAGSKITQESHLRVRSHPVLEQVRHLSDHQLRDNQRPWVRKQQTQARFVIPIVLVYVRV